MEEIYYFNHMFQTNRKSTRDKIENMNTVISNLIEEVQSKNLSPIEQVMYVYDFVKSLKFAENDTTIEKRQVDCVLYDRQAVGAGFSDTFNEILRRMGFKTAIIENYIGDVSHMNSIVEIVDSKYEINGIYNFDSTFDSSNENSYAFFGRTMEEFNLLKKKRKGRGCSLALTEGNTGNNLEQVLSEIPLRTMNIINGFFPTQENFENLKKIYREGSDKSKWRNLNEQYSFQLFNLGFKYRSAERIPTDVLEKIIYNVWKTKISSKELDSKILKIKKETNSNFEKNYNDPRLIFKIENENHIKDVDYESYMQRIDEMLDGKKENDEMISRFEFFNGQNRKVVHRLIKNTDGQQYILLESEFDYNYDFGIKLLSPALEKYIDQCDLPVGKIGKPEYANFNIRDYKMISSNGLSLIIEACDLEFLKSLDIYIKKKYMIQQIEQNFSNDKYSDSKSKKSINN